MNKALIVLLLAAVAANAQKSKHWAVLVAGSNTWMNYRHQADVCHAYQIVTKKGIPPERVIVMMYDDIAYNKQNPTPGIIINRPNGPDVYHGVKIDYKGKHVSPENFLNVLRGEKEAMAGIGSGKVLESGPDDHVFVYFADHGSPGIFYFQDRMLYADDLRSAILTMHKKKMYKKMVFYVEACESGSMFANGSLPENINVYATTAANPHEPSYVCYFDKKLKTFLGDVYSVNWMQDSDVAPQSETMKQQYEIVKKETNTSHVQEYGNMTLAHGLVFDYQGQNSDAHDQLNERIPEYQDPNMDAVPSQDVELTILRLKLKASRKQEERRTLLSRIMAILETRRQTSETFKRIVSLAVDQEQSMEQQIATQRRSLLNMGCYKHAVEHLRVFCSKMDIAQNGYGHRHLYKLVNLCETRISLKRILDAISTTAEDKRLC